MRRSLEQRLSGSDRGCFSVLVRRRRVDNNGSVAIALALVAGIGSVMSGLAMLTNYRGWGTSTVLNIPKFFRMGDVDTHRKILGVGYLGVGLVFLVVGFAALVHSL